MADIVLKDRQGVPQTYPGYTKVAFNTPDSGTVIFSEGEATENVPIELALAAGDQTVEAQSGTLIKSAVIKKPAALSPANIAKDVNVAGVVGEYETPAMENVEIIPDFSNGDQSVAGEGGALIKSAIIRKPSTLTPGNIAAGIDVAGVVGTLSGAVSENDINFYDYDGTLVASWSLSELAAKTELPENPSHNGLIAQGWNWTLAELKEHNSKMDVGQMYTTVSGKSEFDIILTKATGLTVSFQLSGEKDWGDGTTDSETSHTYAEYGAYTISWSGAELSGDTGSLGYVFKNNSNTAISYALQAIRFGSNVTSVTGNKQFMYCYSLKTVSMPSTFPSEFRYGSMFEECRTLRAFVYPAGSRNQNDSSPQKTFYNCVSLRVVCFSPLWTAFQTYIMYNCHTLKRIRFSKNLSIIKGSAIIGTYSIDELDFSGHEQIPTLASTNNLQSFNASGKIIVPDALYDDWISATNWTGYSNYIYKASEV